MGDTLAKCTQVIIEEGSVVWWKVVAGKVTYQINSRLPSSAWDRMR